MTIMKSLRTKTFALLASTAVLGLAAAGCSATATRESTGEYVDDSAITAKVKTALIGDPAVKAFQINVKTFRGVVQLSGFVDNQNEKDAALQDAQKVPGVQQVQNDIALKTP